MTFSVAKVFSLILRKKVLHCYRLRDDLSLFITSEHLGLKFLSTMRKYQFDSKSYMVRWKRSSTHPTYVAILRKLIFLIKMNMNIFHLKESALSNVSGFIFTIAIMSSRCPLQKEFQNVSEIMHRSKNKLLIINRAKCEKNIENLIKALFFNRTLSIHIPKV